jgi:hypothetical protein
MFGESIASEGVGEHMFVEGRVLTTDGKPIPGAVVETWETDGEGELAFFDVSMFSRLMMDRHAFPKPLGVYDMQYAERTAPGVSWPTEDRRRGEVRVSRDRSRIVCHSR